MRKAEALFRSSTKTQDRSKKHSDPLLPFLLLLSSYPTLTYSSTAECAVDVLQLPCRKFMGNRINAISELRGLLSVYMRMTRKTNVVNI